MIRYEKVCAYCGQNIEHQESIQGKEQTVCKYGKCINDYNNCKYRVKNYRVHKNQEIREFTLVIQSILDKKLPVINYDRQLKLMALASRKNGIAKLPMIDQVNS